MGEELDQRSQDAAALFMALPEMRETEVVEGREVTGFSTTDDAAEGLIAGLSPDKKVELIRDIFADEEKYPFDPFMIFTEGNMTGAQAIDAILVEIIVQRIRRMPEVLEREESNTRTHDAGVHGIDDE